MQFNLTARKFAVLTLAGVISIAGTGIAFAADQSDNGQNGNRFHPKPNRVNFEEMSAIYQTALDGLVDEGTITQEQSEAVTENMTAKVDKIKNDGARIERSLNREHKGPMSRLVDDETITQEQADLILAAMKDAKESGEGLRDILEELVNDDVLTQDQANAVIECMVARGHRAKQEGDKTEKRGMGEYKGPMSTLIDAGMITQEQANAITEAVKAAIEATRESE